MLCTNKSLEFLEFVGSDPAAGCETVTNRVNRCITFGRFVGQAPIVILIIYDDYEAALSNTYE